MNKLKIAPARSQFSILRQICNFIPQHLVSKIARTTGAEDKSRTFSPWSHVVSLGYAQLTHSIGLNDVCDSLQLHSGPLAGIRGATAPSRNGLSYRARQRNTETATPPLSDCRKGFKVWLALRGNSPSKTPANWWGNSGKWGEGGST